MITKGMASFALMSTAIGFSQTDNSGMPGNWCNGSGSGVKTKRSEKYKKQRKNARKQKHK